MKGMKKSCTGKKNKATKAAKGKAGKAKSMGKSKRGGY